jgi:hypothetical protein
MGNGALCTAVLGKPLNAFGFAFFVLIEIIKQPFGAFTRFVKIGKRRSRAGELVAQQIKSFE